MKTIFLFFFISISLFASNLNHHQVDIIEKILSEISIDKKLKIWSDNPRILRELKEHKRFQVVNNMKQSNMVILEDKNNFTNACMCKSVFVLKYKLLSEIPKSFGALFWKKGRPNIVIIEPRIKFQSIKISKALEPYLEEKVW